MNVLDAAHRMGLEYPGGMTALAARMGIRPAVLRGKLNPQNTMNFVTLAEAMLMQSITGRTDILHAMADELGYACLPLPQVDLHDDQLATAITKTCAEFGDYLRRIDATLADGRVTPNEVKRLEKELTEMMAAASHLHHVVAAKAKR